MPAFERIVFFGTPAFAVPALDALVAAGRRPLLVVSQPARPAGRGRKLLDPPVAQRARELGLEVAQPERVRAPEFLDALRTLAPDLAIVVAFGQIFPKALLELPRGGCLNLHASLLPRWRGAAPIAAAIAAGDEATGVCLMRMEEGLDTGPVLARIETAIGARESAGALTERLAAVGARLLVDALPELERGALVESAQPVDGATYAGKLGAPRRIELASSAAEIDRAVRAATPEPGAQLVLAGETIKLLELAPVPEATASEAGRVLAIAGSALRVACGDGAIDLVRVQRPGGRPISGRDLANGLRLAIGDRLS